MEAHEFPTHAGAGDAGNNAKMGRIQPFRPHKGLDFRRQQSVHGCTDTSP